MITSDEQKSAADGGGKSCAPGTRCAQQAALRGRGWTWVGAGGEPGREPSHPSAYTPYPLVCLSRVSISRPLPWLALPSFEMPPRHAPPFHPNLLPHRLWRLKEGSRHSPCSAVAWDPLGDASRDLGLLGEGCLPSPRSGMGNLGRGAGQGRKRAGAVFVAALPSGTDGWGGERVRGGEEEGCGGRRMRNVEFRRPESPRRSPPPGLFPERGAG